MQAGGLPKCDFCGMEYTQERIRERVQEIKGSVETVKGGSDQRIRKGFDNLNLSNFSVAEQIFDELLESIPDDPRVLLGMSLSVATHDERKLNIYFTRLIDQYPEITSAEKEYFKQSQTKEIFLLTYYLGGDFERLKYVIDNGAPLNFAWNCLSKRILKDEVYYTEHFNTRSTTKDKRLASILLDAVYFDKLEIVKYLLSRNALLVLYWKDKINYQMAAIAIVLDLLISAVDFEMMDLIVKNTSQNNVDYVYSRHFENFNYIFSVGNNRTTMLGFCIQSMIFQPNEPHWLRVAEFLIKRGANTNPPFSGEVIVTRYTDSGASYKDSTYVQNLVSLAVMFNQLPAVKFLVDHGADISGIDLSSINNLEIKKYLKERQKEIKRAQKKAKK